MVDVLVIRIKVVQNHTRIARVACRKHDNLEFFSQILEDLPAIWPNVYARFDNLACWKLNRKFDVVFDVQILIAVDQSLIKVKNYCLFA